MFRTTSGIKLLLTMHVTTISHATHSDDTASFVWWRGEIRLPIFALYLIGFLHDSCYSISILENPSPPPSIFQPPNRSAVTIQQSLPGKLSGHTFCIRPNRNLFREFLIRFNESAAYVEVANAPPTVDIDPKTKWRGGIVYRREAVRCVHTFCIITMQTGNRNRSDRNIT